MAGLNYVKWFFLVFRLELDRINFWGFLSCFLTLLLVNKWLLINEWFRSRKLLPVERVFWDSMLFSLMHDGSSAVTPLSRVPGTKAPSRMPVYCSGSSSLPPLPEPSGEQSMQPGRARHCQALTALLPPTSWSRPSGKKVIFWGCLWGREEGGLDLTLAGGHTSTACSPSTTVWVFPLFNPCYQMLYACN